MSSENRRRPGWSDEQARDRAGVEKDMFNNNCLLPFVVIIGGIVGSLVGLGKLIVSFV